MEQAINDEIYMKRAIKLAKKGQGKVSPNPLVGAVIVKNDQIISEGYHEKYGSFHAERNAINKAIFSGLGNQLEGSTIYVTLEPCCHYGKTPPCTEAIIKNKISKVVIGSKDPNPLVAGSGIKQLKDAGVEVVSGILEDECNQLNEIFFHYIKTHTPFVLMKYAMTCDGKIATRTGLSKWITGEVARKEVHRYRNIYSAIAVGIGTVLADDPLLTCRIDGGRNPIRVICDDTLKIPLSSQIVSTAKEVKTIIACKSGYENTAKAIQLQEKGCEIISIDEDSTGHIDMQQLMIELGKRNIDSLIVEGGATFNWAALNSGIVNKVHTYIAPKLFGGKEAPSPVSGLGVKAPDDSILLETKLIKILGDDILIESVVKQCLQD